MKFEKVDIKDLMPDPANVRKHSRKNLDAIKGSLARFGQQKPIVVDKNNIVIAGNGTLEAAKELGWKHKEIREDGFPIQKVVQLKYKFERWQQFTGKKS